MPCVQHPTSQLFSSRPIYIGNVAVSGVLLLLLTNLLVFAGRVMRAKRRGKVWSVLPSCCGCHTRALLPLLQMTCVFLVRKPRQKRNAILFFMEAAVQCLNLTFYLIPNTYILCRPCHQLTPLVFWSGWVRWTCWNTVSPCRKCQLLWYAIVSQTNIHTAQLYIASCKAQHAMLCCAVLCCAVLCCAVLCCAA